MQTATKHNLKLPPAWSEPPSSLTWATAITPTGLSAPTLALPVLSTQPRSLRNPSKIKVGSYFSSKPYNDSPLSSGYQSNSCPWSTRTSTTSPFCFQPGLPYSLYSSHPDLLAAPQICRPAASSGACQLPFLLPERSSTRDLHR